MNFLFQFLIDRSIDRSYGKWSTPVLNNSLSCIAQKVTLSNVFLFISLLRQEKNPLLPFAMERLGSICSYGNNDSRFKIWRYTFYHFRSYSTWKIVAISAHCIMEIHHRIFHRFFHSKNGIKSSRATAETAERQEKLQGSESFLFSLHFLAIKRGGLYVQKCKPLLSQTPDRWYRRVSMPYFPVCRGCRASIVRG